MKKLLSTLILFFFCFGANAEYNKKFSKKKCLNIFQSIQWWENEIKHGFKFTYKGSRDFKGYSREDYELTMNHFNTLINLYKTFCKTNTYD